MYILKMKEAKPANSSRQWCDSQILALDNSATLRIHRARELLRAPHAGRPQVHATLLSDGTLEIYHTQQRQTFQGSRTGISTSSTTFY